MSSSGGFGAVEASAADQLDAAVSGVFEVSLTPMSDDEVVDLMRDVERCARRLVAVQHRLLIDADERALPARSGRKSLKKFLMHALRLSSAEAGSRISHARAVGVSHDSAGEPVEPALPHTAEALTAGEVSRDHVRGIAAVINRIPDSVPAPERAAAEQVLAEFSRSGSPDDLGKLGEHLLAQLDPGGSVTTDRDRARMRGITLGRQRADGMSPVHGCLDPVLRALLDPLLAAYARPGMCHPDDPGGPAPDNVAAGDADSPGFADAAGRDRRSPAQRNHDAIKALLSSGVVGDKLGSHRGMPVSTVLTMSVDQVDDAAGVATTATGGTVPIRDALVLAQRSQPFLAVFDHGGLPLHLARTRRLASSAQRLALIAALRGCSRPGCDAPASLCAVHHVLDYRRHGATDIDNLTLACDSCHALIHDGPGGWKTVVTGPDSPYPGRTAWIPPPHIDPTGTPVVNHRHHANELLAEVLSRRHRNDISD